MTIPIGIAAGMIKTKERFKPELLGLVDSITFGSFTISARSGNTGQTFWYDPNADMSLNAIGLANQGLQAFLDKDLIFTTHGRGTNAGWGKTKLRVSIAPLKRGDCTEMIGCINKHVLRHNIDEIEVNAACPNHRDEDVLHPVLAHDYVAVEQLLQECTNCTIPLALKIAPYTKINTLKRIVDLCKNYNIVTLVSGNTMLRSSVVDGIQRLSAEKGGMGGRPLLPYALRQMRILESLRNMLGANIKLVFCGGTTSAEAVRLAEESSADEVQVATLYYQFGVRGIQDLLVELHGS